MLTLVTLRGLAIEIEIVVVRGTPDLMEYHVTRRWAVEAIVGGEGKVVRPKAYGQQMSVTGYHYMI